MIFSILGSDSAIAVEALDELSLHPGLEEGLGGLLMDFVDIDVVVGELV